MKHTGFLCEKNVSEANGGSNLLMPSSKRDQQPTLFNHHGARGSSLPESAGNLDYFNPSPPKCSSEW